MNNYIPTLKIHELITYKIKVFHLSTTSQTYDEFFRIVKLLNKLNA